MTDIWTTLGPARDGASFHTTIIGDITISWIRDNRGKGRGGSAIHAILDAASTAPARRITAASPAEPIEGESHGLTVYGTGRHNRPAPEEVAQQTPEYAEVMADYLNGVGTTTFAGGGEALLTAADVAEKLHLSVRTIHKYHHDGRLPAADQYIGRTPLWRQAVIDEVAATRRGPGRPRKPAHP